MSTCETCRFWAVVHMPSEDCGIGECRKHAPVPAKYQWPQTNNDDWCGDWLPEE